MRQGNLSNHIATIGVKCAQGKANDAKSLISSIDYSDYRSRYIAWVMVRDAAILNDDLSLARRAADEADDYQRRLERGY